MRTYCLYRSEYSLSPLGAAAVTAALARGTPGFAMCLSASMAGMRVDVGGWPTDTSKDWPCWWCVGAGVISSLCYDV